MMLDKKQLLARARNVKLALFDVDGVMTEGLIIYGEHGETLQAFNVLDGFGMQLLQSTGVEVGIITGRFSMPLEQRLEALNIKLCLQEQNDKLSALQHILSERQLSLSEVAYLGDDWPDLPLIRAVGLGMTVPNGRPQVKQCADGITEAPGGRGAVREFCELIMQAQETLAVVYARYDTNSALTAETVNNMQGVSRIMAVLNLTIFPLTYNTSSLLRWFLLSVLLVYLIIFWLIPIYLNQKIPVFEETANMPDYSGSGYYQQCVP